MKLYNTMQEAQDALAKRIAYNEKWGYWGRKYRIQAYIDFGAPDLPMKYAVVRIVESK